MNDTVCIQEQKQKIVSPSELSSFFSCPARWRYEKLGLIGIEVDTAALEFGSAVHAGIAAYLKEISTSSPYITRNGIEDSLHRHLREIEGDQNRIDKIIKHVTTYEMNRLFKYGKEHMSPVFVEQRIEIPPFKGIIDFVHQTNIMNQVVIVDWKTGRFNPNEWMNVQMSVYAYLLTKSGYNVSHANIYFVEHGMISQAIIDVKYALEKAAVFFNRISNPNYHYPKNRTFYCKWCPFQLICFHEENRYFLDFPTRTTESRIKYEVSRL